MKKYTLKDYLDIKTSGGGSFSPDAKRVAYVDNSTGTFQLHTVSIDGTNIKRITNYEDRIVFARYMPLSEEIIFGRDAGGNENIQLFMYDVKSGEVRQLTDNLEASHRFGGVSKDDSHITFSSNEQNGKDFDIYVMNLATLERTCVYQNRGWCDSLGFSPEGKHIVVSNRESLMVNNLHLVDLETNESKIITNPKISALHVAPCWKSGGTGFYFMTNADGEFISVALYDLQANTIEQVLSAEWDVWELALSPDDKHLAVIVNEEGYGALKVYRTDTMELMNSTEVPVGLVGNIRWSNDSKSLLFNFGSASAVNSVWTWHMPSKKTWQVTPNNQTIPKSEMIEPTLIRYESFDGLSIPSFLYMPKDVEAKTLPVIVQIHGGPESQYRPDFNPLTQYFLNNGYAVAAPNVRGSTGYGKEYVTLDDKEKRLDSVKDIVALHKHLKSLPEIDGKKIVLMGGSYGGYMVLAGLAFYPEYWAAGVDIVGIANFVSFLENTADWRRKIREAEYGSLDTDKEMLKAISPIHKAGDISAPLFIVHGANDPRVPLSEAEQIHDTLKKQGKDVEINIYDDEGHGLAKLKNRIDAYTKMVAFLDKRVK